jgi:glycosyltransferase involved in cell wall biosynthesis
MNFHKMRICLCDYSGHPFQVQLSRELARRGHDVLHLHFAEFLTPKARLQVDSNDPPTLAIEGISLGRPFAKYGFVKRRFQEIDLGRRFAGRVMAYNPDLVIGCNLPLDSLSIVAQSCRRFDRPFVFWQQDIYSAAISIALSKRFGLMGRVLARHYHLLEQKVAAQSAAIIVISESFCATLVRDFHVPASKIHVIENWAPLDEIVPRPKVNPWSIANDLKDKQVVLYTGTLGLKHNPDCFLDLAEAFRDRHAIRIVVASEGPFAEKLARRAAESGLSNLKVIPFQNFAVYSDLLGTADVLVAILEPDAGQFSVPSKVLSYLCADRPIVLSAPPENLASQTLQRAGAGLVVHAGNRHDFVDAVTTLLDHPDLRTECAQSGLRYAHATFEIGRICDRFLSVFDTLKPSTIRPNCGA